MPSIDEASAANEQGQLPPALFRGLGTISREQEITFTRYVKLILPIDGYVFWVNSGIVSQGALLNAMSFNRVPFNSFAKNNGNATKLGGGIGQFAIGVTPIGGYGDPRTNTFPAKTIVAKGSLHYATDTRQEESETLGVNRVVFTSEQEIQDLNEIGPNELYIGRFQSIRFAFSSRSSFYEQAGIYHYVGDAIYSDMESQIIDDPYSFDTRNAVVSNSLPIWLSMNNYEAAPYELFGNPALKLYPSFLLDTNLRPPYAAVHIEETDSIGAAPRLSSSLSHSQLVREKVRITIYGLRNYNAIDFVDFVNQFCLNTELFGLMNSPVLRDEKRTQPELNTIAMKKVIEFEIDYYQERARDVARQLLTSAIPAYRPLTAAAASIIPN
jgi:hypothetical protein